MADKQLEMKDKKERIYLKNLQRMMDGMSIKLAEIVHLLFMNNYINYSDYGFMDE